MHLNGAMELAPGLGLSRLIVDLVATGSTLKANGLVETEVIAHVTSRLIVNRTALKTRPEAVGAWIARFRAALDAAMNVRALALGRSGFSPAPQFEAFDTREPAVCRALRRAARGARDHRRGSMARWPRSSPTCARAATRR